MAFDSDYKQMWREHPQGTLYPVDLPLPWITIPHRFDFVAEPLTEYRVAVNGTTVAAVTRTDANGDGTVSVKLAPGRAHLSIFDPRTGYEIRSFRASILPQALFLHLHAREFAGTRSELQRLRDALSISTADGEFLGAVYGNRLRYPNRTAADLITYREQLRTVRQVNKHLATTTDGLAQVVAATTGSRPFQLPEHWQPGWFLGDHLAAQSLRSRSIRPAGLASAFDVFADLATSNLNVAVREWALGAGGFPANDLRTIAPGSANNPGPYVTLPEGGARLELVFEAGWDGGNVSVTGTLTDGRTLTEVFTGPSSPPSDTSVVGRYQFASISLIQKGVVGASAAPVHVGLRDQRFVRLQSIGHLNASNIGASAALDLDYDSTNGLFYWNGALYNGLGVEAAASGLLTVGGAAGTVPTIVGVQSTATTFDLTTPGSGVVSPAGFANTDRLLLSLDRLGEVPVRLSTSATPTPAQVVADVNAWVDMWPPMGGDRAYVDLTITNYAAISDGDHFTAVDQLGASATLEWDTVPNGVVAGRVTMDVSGATSNLEAAIVVVQALGVSRVAAVGVINPTGSGGTTATPVVRIYQALAGNNTQVTTPSTISGGWTVSAAFANGGPATERGTAVGKLTAAVISAHSAGTEDAIELSSSSEDGLGFQSRAVGVVAGPLDAEPYVLGRKQARSTTDAAIGAAAYGPLTVSCASTAWLQPGGPEVLRPWQSGAQTIRTMARGSGLEVWFSPDYEGPESVQLTGLDCFGNAITEIVYWPGLNVVEEGGGANYTNASTLVSFIDPLPTKLQPGLGLRKYVFPTPQIEIVLRWGLDPASGNPTIQAFNPYSGTDGDELWQLIDKAVVPTTQVFESLTNVNSGTITSGYIAVYVAGTAEASNPTVRLGRGTVTDSGTDVTLADESGAHRATLVGYASQPNDAWLAVGAWASADLGTNAGLHEINDLDPVSSPSTALVTHEFAAIGKHLAAGADGAVAWAAISRGEAIPIGYNDTGANDLSVLGFLGTTQAWASGSLIEWEAEQVLEVVGPVRGKDDIQILVDADYAPTTDQTDTITVYGSRLPDRWRSENIDLAAASGFTDRQGMPDTPLNLEVTSASAAFIEFEAPRLLGYRSLPATLRCWLSNHADTSRTFEIGISFDGGATFSTQSQALASTPFGSAAPTTVELTVTVPAEARLVPIVRVARSAAGASADDQWAIHEIILSSDFHEQAFLGSGTVPKGYEDVGSDVVWVTGSEAADQGTRELLGLPSTPGQALEGYELEAEGSVRGHVDHLSVLHAKHYRADLTQGALIRGVYTFAEWLTATLTNLSPISAAPDQLSRAVPEQPTQVSNEALTTSAPSNATVARVPLASAIDVARRRSTTLLPAPGITPGDRLYQGSEILANTQVGDKAVVTLSPTGGAGTGSIVVTWADTGTAPNGAVSVTVVNPGARSPLSAGQDAAGNVTITLAHDGTALLDEINTTRNVGQALTDLETLEVEVVGDPDVFFAALDAGATAFAGGDPNPWRWISSSELQIASVGAGDPVEFDVYGGGGDAYAVEYLQLTRAQTPTLDLSADFADHLWAVDLAMYRRLGHVREEERQYERLNLLTDRTARVSYEAKITDSSNQLYVDDGVNGLRPVPKRLWQFLEPRFIQVDGAAFSPDAVYWLDYTAIRLRRDPLAQFLLEIRSGTSAAAAEAAEWRPIEPDGLVDVTAGNRYHQLRVSFWGIETVQDLVVYGLGLRGFKITGSDPAAPGLVPC